jgi:hypothetical protein
MIKIAAVSFKFKSRLLCVNAGNNKIRTLNTLLQIFKFNIGQHSFKFMN